MLLFKKINNTIVKVTFAFLLSITFNITAFSAQIHVEGIYRGENLYIMNPFSSSGIGFCVSEVKVNGQITTDEINSSAFEIDFSSFNLKLGDKVSVDITHKDGCSPKILNPEVLKPKSTYMLQYITVDKTGILRWATTGEKGKIPFIIQEFRWNKWINIGKVDGKGTSEKNIYSKKVYFHSGINKFRVKQTDYSKRAKYSAEAKFLSLMPAVTFTPGNGREASKEIIFSTKTKYEIYNYYGSLIKRGTSNKVDVSKLKKGTYFLNYDNKMESFKKK